MLMIKILKANLLFPWPILQGNKLKVVPKEKQ